MQLFDSHCHLDDRAFERDFTDVLQRAKTTGVQQMLIAGIDRDTSHRAAELASHYPELFAAVGVHPHDSQSCSESILADLQQLAATPKVVAWGEIGLDFNRMYSPQPDQEHWFHRQLEIASTLKLPLIFHERDSQGRFLEILRSLPKIPEKAVVHCFSGSESELAQYLEMGFYIGITGIVTIRQRGEQLRRMIPGIPSARLVVETDAPYLTPSPHRNKARRNEPAFVRDVLLKVAEVRGEDPGTLAEQVWDNTCRLFDIAP